MKRRVKMDKHISTKEKILFQLKKSKSAESTIKEIMEPFTISETAVRKHIQELISTEFIKERVVKQEIGRPYHLYSLTSKGHATFPNQKDELPVDLLQDLEEVGGKTVVDELLLKRKEREEKELIQALEHLDVDKKISQLTALQNDKGYMMEYKKRADGNYEIINYNCPIYNLASSYKQVCQNENGMIKKIFIGEEVEANACIVKGDHYCGWILSTQKNEKEII